MHPRVLVTGATSGIGRETALRFSRRGARLVLAARCPDELHPVAAECVRAGATQVAVHTVDVGDHDQVRSLIEAAAGDLAGVDIVVHCAAVTAFGRFDEVPVEVFDAVIRTNLSGSANVARAALEHFRPRGSGQLVLVGSLLGKTAMPYQSAYVASKFALGGLVRVLRQENRDSRYRRGIAVHGVYPGPVDTPIYPNAANYFGKLARPMPPTYAPERVAAVIVRATDRARSSEHDVNWVSGPLLGAYRLLPRMFDAVIGPAMRVAGFNRTPIAPTDGNVFEPVTGDKAGRR